jgi:hypothetical protein
MSSVYAFKRATESQESPSMSISNDERAGLIPVRTAVGDTALKAAESSMPRKLRALLSAIDNRAKTHVYCSTLTAFGDVSAMLDALEEIGMVRFIGDRSPAALLEKQETVRSLVQDTSLEELLANDLRESSRAPAQHVPIMEVRQSEPSPQHRPYFDQPTYASAPPAFKPANAPSAANAFKQFNQHASSPQAVSTVANIEKVKTLMTDFVLTHFSADAMELTLAIDQIRTLDDLRSSLFQYEAIAMKAGKPGQAHLQSIKALLPA